MKSTTTLKIARDLALDPDYVGGGTFAVLAKKGAGKSYLMRVLAEEFWREHVQFVALDPMGAGWGLRSSADGRSEGIPIAIFGGDHGDAPLERTAGRVMADLAIDEGLSMVLDMSGFGSRAAERQFATDFLERLYRHNAHSGRLIHLLIDEADLFAPQKPASGDQMLLGITENIVRRGRNRGIGCTLITQRPAVLNKDVLTQIDALVAMRITGFQDREAIDDWVSGHGDKEAAKEVKGTLSGLENGESWWWIPELGILKRVQVRASETFDSSPTRKRNAARAEPKSFADVDMGLIESRMAATIERAKASDPKELQKRVRELEAELRKRPTEVVESVTEIKVPVLESETLGQLEEAIESLASVAGKIVAATNEVGAALGRLKARPVPAPVRHEVAPRPAARPPAAPRARAVTDPDARVTPAQQRILNALAMLEAIGVDQPGKTQLALFAETSPKSSGYANNLGALRTAGLIDYLSPGTASLTEDGRGIAVAESAPGTVEELHAYVRSMLPPAKARIVDALIAAYPQALPKDELAERAETSATSSGYANNLGSLRSLGLIDYPAPGYAAATKVLFLEAA